MCRRFSVFSVAKTRYTRGSLGDATDGVKIRLGLVVLAVYRSVLKYSTHSCLARFPISILSVLPAQGVSVSLILEILPSIMVAALSSRVIGVAVLPSIAIGITALSSKAIDVAVIPSIRFAVLQLHSHSLNLRFILQSHCYCLALQCQSYCRSQR